MSADPTASATAFAAERTRLLGIALLARLTLAVVAINGWNRFNIAFNVPAGSYKAGSLKALRAQAT